MEKYFNKRIGLFIFSILLLIVISISYSFAYIRGGSKDNESVSTVALKGGNINVRYSNNSRNIIANDIVPGYEITKQFTITSEFGDRDYYSSGVWYTVVLIIDKNSFDDNSIQYSISIDDSSSKDGIMLANENNIGIPKSISTKTIVIGSGRIYSNNTSHIYNLKISYPYKKENQSHEVGCEFHAHIDIINNDFVKLTFDLNGGKYNNFNLYNNSVDVPANSKIDMPIPIKNNYAFVGWELLNGNASFDRNIVLTNSSEVSLKALWKATTPYESAYTGTEQEFIAENSGYYKLEAWGAQGGNSSKGGKGSYSSGVIKLEKNDKLYIYVGGVGPSNASVTNVGGYNGGGYSGNDSSGQSYGGGGATDFRLINGNWNDASGLKSRILIAAGGAGSVSVITTIGGGGGGLIGGNGTSSHSTFNTSEYLPIGSNQTSAGFAYQTTTRAGSFGYAYQSNTSGWGGGGGGGYYGGGNGHGTTGAGGSSYISGHTGCVAIVSVSSTSSRTGTGGASCTTGTSDNLCSVHYSGKVFTDTVMIDGAGYAWTNTKGALQQMPNPNGGYYASGVGHSGNGYARITYLHV